jgi:hypothetical protein
MASQKEHLLDLLRLERNNQVALQLMIGDIRTECTEFFGEAKKFMSNCNTLLEKITSKL